MCNYSHSTNEDADSRYRSIPPHTEKQDLNSGPPEFYTSTSCPRSGPFLVLEQIRYCVGHSVRLVSNQRGPRVCSEASVHRLRDEWRPFPRPIWPHDSFQVVSLKALLLCPWSEVTRTYTMLRTTRQVSTTHLLCPGTYPLPSPSLHFLTYKMMLLSSKCE